MLSCAHMPHPEKRRREANLLTIKLPRLAARYGSSFTKRCCAITRPPGRPKFTDPMMTNLKKGVVGLLIGRARGERLSTHTQIEGVEDSAVSRNPAEVSPGTYPSKRCLSCRSPTSHRPGPTLYRVPWSHAGDEPLTEQVP